MGVKRISLLIFIIALALTGYVFLKNKYNPLGVEMHFRGDLSNEELLEITKRYNIQVYTINYETTYKESNLIMTTGNDTQLKYMDLAHGSFVFDINRNTVVIGDEIANKYFRTENVVGRKISILGHQYKIVGVIKNNNELYIPFKKELLGYDWGRKTVSLEVPDPNAFYLIVEKIDTELEALGIEIYDITVYREKIAMYLNVVILVLVYILSYFAVRIWKNLRNNLTSLYLGYHEVYRITEWHRYVINNRIAILKGTGRLIGFILIIILIFRLFISLSLPPAILPDNFFSIKSYLLVIEQKHKQLLTHLKNGFSSIVVDVIILNIVFILVIIVMAIGFRVVKKS
jgi:hypothetical protein